MTGSDPDADESRDASTNGSADEPVDESRRVDRTTSGSSDDRSATADAADKPQEPFPNELHDDTGQPSQAPVDEQYSTPIAYDETKTDDADYKSYSDLTFEQTLSHPVDDVETLRQTKHLTAQLHMRNVEAWTDHALANDGGALYDVTVLDVAPRMLSLEGIELSALSMKPPRVLFLFLRRARESDHVPELRAHIEDTQPVLKALRAHAEEPDTWRLYGKRTYNRARNALPDALAAIGADIEAFNDAVTRAVYAVYRNGVRPPEDVMTAYGFPEAPYAIAETDIEYAEQRAVLRNYIKWLAAATLGPLTFDRSDPTHDMLRQVGLLATAALINAGRHNASKVARWDHPPEVVPGGTGFVDNLDRITEGDPTTPTPAARHLPKHEYRRINKQFDAVNINTLDLAHDAGLFEDPVTLAFDTYRIKYDSDDAPLTISRYIPSENEVIEEFHFMALTVIDTHAQFTIGTRMLSAKTEYADAIEGLLSIAPAYLDIDTILADAELASADIIEIFREYAGEDWIINAPDKDTIEALHNYTPANYVGYVDQTFKNLDPSPHGVAYPLGRPVDPKGVRFTRRQLKADDPPARIQDETDLFQFATTPPSHDATDDATLPAVDEVFDDLNAQPGVTDNRETPLDDTHATYLTDRSLPERSAVEIRFEYYHRWAIEANIDQLKNHFMPAASTDRGEVRLYYERLASVLKNWHTLINRVPSPNRAIPLPTVTHQAVLKAIQHVAFDPDREPVAEPPESFDDPAFP